MDAAVAVGTVKLICCLLLLLLWKYAARTSDVWIRNIRVINKHIVIVITIDWNNDVISKCAASLPI